MRKKLISLRPQSFPFSTLPLAKLGRTALGLAALALATAAALSPTPALAVASATAQAASRTATETEGSTDSFTYDTWRVDYAISTNDEGRAIARVTETVEPRFPSFDQNRGIVRGIPIDYRGSSTDPRDFSVTDANGAAVPFEIEDDGNFRVVLVGDDSYLHGLQHFAISYTISDIVLQPDDAAAQEFYWDVMDFEHKQPVGAFSAQFVFEGDLADELNGNTTCYTGAAESTDRCTLAGSGTAADPLRIDPIRLAPQQGVTVAVGLSPNAVVQPPSRLPNFALDGLPLILSGAGLAVGGAGAVSVARERARRRKFRGTAVAQYDVPQYLPPLIAGPIVGGSLGDAAAAEIVHLAVSGVTRLEDGPPKKGKSKPTPMVAVVDPSRAADPLDTLALHQLIPGAVPGATIKIPRKSTEFATSMTSLQASGAEAAVDRGYIERVATPLSRALGIVALVIAVLSGLFAVYSFSERGNGQAVIAGIISLAALVMAVKSLAKHRMHTRLGAETREYLEGVRLFIKVAEADRIKMLQSPDGAERRSVEGVEVIHLYERLLPYAMLFNLEKEWGKVLQVRYEATPEYLPYWYPAMLTSGTGDMTNALAGYTSALSSAVSYTESSSSGSTGGGFAGGGGGGGFSGGR